MIPASQIKKSIDFNKGFYQLLEVLKLVAVTQYHDLERKLQTFESLKAVIADFIGSFEVLDIQHPFLGVNDRPLGIVAVTSDVGLLGGMNTQVVGRALDLVARHQGHLVLIGEKGQAQVQDTGIPFDYFPGLTESERYAQACEVRDHLTKKLISGQIGGVTIVFPQALSLVTNHIETESLLPFKPPEKSEASKIFVKGLIMESSPVEIVEYLVYLLLGQRLFEIFGMSRLGEKASRFVHLEESGQKVQKMNEKLTLQYFRRRHEMVDQNMRELSASRKLYGKK